MQKQYNHVKLNPSRFSFHEFCKMVWRMSEKEDWHYIDFKNQFEGELKALYLKTGQPAEKVIYRDNRTGATLKKGN